MCKQYCTPENFSICKTYNETICKLLQYYCRCFHSNAKLMGSTKKYHTKQFLRGLIDMHNTHIYMTKMKVSGCGSVKILPQELDKWAKQVLPETKSLFRNTSPERSGFCNFKLSQCREKYYFSLAFEKCTILALCITCLWPVVNSTLFPTADSRPV